MRLTATLSVRLREQAVVDVVVLLQRALGPLDQLGDAGAEVVAQQRLLLVLWPVVLQQVNISLSTIGPSCMTSHHNFLYFTCCTKYQQI